MTVLQFLMERRIVTAYKDGAVYRTRFDGYEWRDADASRQDGDVQYSPLSTTKASTMHPSEYMRSVKR